MSELEVVARILTSIVLSGLIGLEREIKGHSAGLRTNMLVGLGATLFMIAAELLTRSYSHLPTSPDPTRIASTIVTGVSFLGAGVIIQRSSRIHNLTTAASIWVVAAVGTLVGSGFYIAATSGTLITLIVLGFLPTFERWIANRFGSARQRERANLVDPDEDAL